MIKEVPALQYFWTFERDGEVFDAEFSSQKEAQEWADDAFAEQCQEEGPRNSETFSEEIFLLRRYCDENTGDWVEVERIKSAVEYEHYHGDHAEHFKQSDYL